MVLFHNVSEATFLNSKRGQFRSQNNIMSDVDTTTNPLEQANVKVLLANADNISSKHDFEKWQKSFLEAFTQFLNSEGSAKAQEAYTKFSQSSSGLFKIVKTLTSCLENGSLSKDHASVKGRRAMTELGTVLSKLVEALQLILPTTMTQITEFGFTKYHMGAVLVEDGFREYAVMQFCQTLLHHLRTIALNDIAGSQVLDEIDYFAKKFHNFCGVMESLNLMKVCQIAQQFLHDELQQESNRVLQSGGSGGDNGKMVAKSQPKEAVPPPPPSPSKAKKSSPALPEKKKEFTVTVHYPEEKKVNAVPKEKENTVKPKFSPPKKNKHYNTDDDSISSYESIEEVITVSSYDTVEMEDDDSSYETLRVVVEESEYETEEEEIIVSDYVTDSDDSQADERKEKRTRPRKKKTKKPSPSKKSDKKTVAPVNPTFSSKGQAPDSRGSGSNTARPRKAPTKASTLPPPTAEHDPLPPPPGNRNKGGAGDGQQDSDQDDPDSNNSSSDSERKDGKKNFAVGDGYITSDSESSGEGNIKARAAVAPSSAPPSPTANEKPVQRIQFTAKDYYHGHSQNHDCFNAWKQYKKDKTGESEHDRQKKMKRIERREIRYTRRKVKDRKVETIRQKKEKPPKMVRVRRTHQVTQTKRVKKDKQKD